MHNNFGLQLLNLLLALFSLDFSLLASFLCVSLVLRGLLLARNSTSNSSFVGLVRRTLIISLVLVSAAKSIGFLLSEFVLFLGSNFALQNLLELSDVIS